MRSVGLLALAACGGDGEVSVPTKSGAVTVQSFMAEQPPGTAVQGGNVLASFAAGESRCTRDVQGECYVLQCATGAGPLASAGTLAITGATRPLSMPPNDDNSYTNVTSETPLYSGGETLEFSASGGDVPGFAESVTAPARVQITSPAKPAQFLAVDRTTGLRITWAGGTGGSLQIALFAGTTTALSVSCRFPLAAGAGMIPPVTLGSLPPGQGGFAMAAIAETGIIAGDWQIVLDAYYNAVWPDNSIVSGPTMVQ